MDESILQGIQQVSESLSKLVDSDAYMSVGFTTQQAGLNPLKGMLTDVLSNLVGKRGDKLAEAVKKIGQEIDESNAADVGRREQIKELGLTLKGIHSKLKAEEDEKKKNTNTLNQYFKNAYDNWRENKGKGKARDKYLGLMYQSVIIGKDLLNVTQKIFNSFNSAMLTNANFSADLRAAGVKIVDGFDEGFLKYSNESGKLREELVELLKQNSQFIASANGQGLNGVSILSKETSKLAGMFGLTSREIDASVKTYNDSMLTTANQAQMANLNHENELVKTTQALKMFAMATGQSYENLVKERQERERTWQMKKLASDPRTRAQYMMLRDLGLSDEMIEGIMLGKVNKATTMALLNADSARMLGMMQSAFRSTINNPAEFYRQLGLINHSAAANGMRALEANMNPYDLAYMPNEMGALYAPGTYMWGKMTASTFDLNAEKYLFDKEAEAQNKLLEVNKDLTKAVNKIKDALAPDLDTISKHYPWVAKSMIAISDALGSVMQWPVIGQLIGGTAVVAQTLAPLADSLMPMFIFGMMSKAKPSVIKLSKDAAGNFIGTITAEASKAGGFFSKLGSVFKYGAGIIGGSILVASAGSIGSSLAKTKGGAATIGALIGGAGGALAIGTLLAPFTGGTSLAVAALLGAAGGATYGGYSAYKQKERELQTSPATELNSQYNSLSNSPSNYTEQPQSSLQPATVNTTYNTVSVIGIDTIRRLLTNIDENTRNMYSAIRTGGMHPGTNLVTG